MGGRPRCKCAHKRIHPSRAGTTDARVPLRITGLSASELQVESAQGYRLIDFGVRSGGMDLIICGVLLNTVLLVGFRQGLRWAWGAMRSLPIWAASVFGGGSHAE